MKAIHKSISALRSACIGGLLLLAAGCFNGLEAPEAPQGAKNGLVTISIGEEARTILPDLGQFDELELVITPAAGEESVYEEIINGTATVYLDEGTWDLEVNGYVGDSKRATAVNTLTNTEGVITGNTRFALAPVGTEKGALQYLITNPAEQDIQEGSRLALSRADGSPVPDLPKDFNEGVLSLTNPKTEGTVQLDPGRYTAEVVLLGTDEVSAALKETVVILPGLRTDLRFEPASFADPSLLAPLSFGKTANNSSDTRIGAAGGTANERTQAIFAAGVQDTVYFTLAKTGAQSVSLAEGVVGVSQGTAAVDGTAPGAGLEVFTVDTSSIRDGGYQEFTLNVTETGKDPITIAVTVSVGGQGFGLFIAATDEGGVETLTLVELEDEPIVDLKTALAYLSASGTSNTTYEIHLNGDEAIPLWEGFNQETQTNITIRLKGMGEARTVSWNGYNKNFVANGLFSLNQTGTTLELDHIILDGKNGSTLIGNNYALVYLGSSGTLILKEGAKITNFVSTNRNTNITTAGMAVVGSYTPTGTFTSGPTLSMKGGEISGNQTVSGLIGVKIFDMSKGIIRNNESSFTAFFTPHLPQSNPYTNNIRPCAVITNKFTMTGGEIRDNGRNSIMSGVGVIANGTMSGGIIEGNGRYGESLVGGGMVLSFYCTSFSMTGGVIRNNGGADTPGNAVFLTASTNQCSAFTLAGPVTFEGRIAVGTYSGVKKAEVKVETGFSNTAGVIIVDIHSSQTIDTLSTQIENKSYISGEEELLKNAFTYGKVIQGWTTHNLFAPGVVDFGEVTELFSLEGWKVVAK